MTRYLNEHQLGESNQRLLISDSYFFEHSLELKFTGLPWTLYMLAEFRDGARLRHCRWSPGLSRKAPNSGSQGRPDVLLRHPQLDVRRQVVVDEALTHGCGQGTPQCSRGTLVARRRRPVSFHRRRS